METNKLTRTIIDGVSKIEIVEKEDCCMVQFFELMGDRWVSFGAAERYCKELAAEF